MKGDNILAGGIFIISTIGFFVWGYQYVPSYHYMLFIVSGIFGIFMAFNVGGNDVANSFGTSVGSKTVTIKQALIIAAIFELSGAIFAGGEVTKTIRQGIISLPSSGIDSMKFVAIMMAALLSSGMWLFFASKKGLPVSTTHSIVGGIVGSGLVMGYMNFGAQEAAQMVSWQGIGKIVISWIISPLLGGVLSYAIYWYIKNKVLEPTAQLKSKLKSLKAERKQYKTDFIKSLKNKPEDEQISTLSRMVLIDEDEIEDGEYTEYKSNIKNMKEREKQVDTFSSIKKHVPIIAAIAAMIISSMMLFKGLKHLKFNLSTIETVWIIFVIGSVAYLAGFAIINVMSKNDSEKSINKIFSWFQIFTASSFAFSHGANDIANAVGPFAAILDVLKTGSINENSPIPSIAMVIFGISLVIGLWFLGKEVITTIGSKLAEILPTTGFSAELGASAVILFATKLGIPVSSTHILIGAVLGIGILNRNANWGMAKPIFMAWIITLPVSAMASGIIYLILTSII